MSAEVGSTLEERAMKLLADALGEHKLARRYGGLAANNASVSVEALAHAFLALGLIDQSQLSWVLVEAEVYRDGRPVQDALDKMRDVALDCLQRILEQVACSAREGTRAMLRTQETLVEWLDAFGSIGLITEEQAAEYADKGAAELMRRFPTLVHERQFYRLTFTPKVTIPAPKMFTNERRDEIQKILHEANLRMMNKAAEQMCGPLCASPTDQDHGAHLASTLASGAVDDVVVLNCLGDGGPTAPCDADPSPIELDVPLTVPVQSAWQGQADRLGL